MKRFLAILVLLASVSTLAFAQKNSVTGSMIINTTDVIKTKKVFAKAKVERGFEQEVNFAWSLMLDWDAVNHINFNYIGGFRFNHHLFVGIGTGLDFGAGHTFKPYVVENHSGMFSSPSNTDYSSYYGGSNLPIQKLSIPIYAHFKVYFMKTRLAPFLAFSGGVRFSASKKVEVYNPKDGYYSWEWEFGDHIRTEKYGAVTGMFEVLPGVSYQFNDKYTFNFQIGYATRSGHEWGSWSNNSLSRTRYHGFTIKLGMVF